LPTSNEEAVFAELDAEIALLRRKAKAPVVNR